jgi:hypothetical protein
MVFWNREALPAELRDKKPEEIAAALKKLEEYETKSKEWDTAKADLESKLTAQGTEFEQVRNRLQEMEQGIQAYSQQQQAQAQPTDAQGTNIWNDPEKYIDQKMQQQMQLRDAMTVANGRGMARLNLLESLSPRDKKIFNKYSKEIEQTVNAYQPGLQTLPQNWFVAFNYVKGLHEQELGKMEADSTPFFAEPGSRGAQPEAPPEDKLTPEEEDICNRFHWDKKGYLERRKQMTVHQAEKGAFARYPVPMRDMSDRR